MRFSRALPATVVVLAIGLGSTLAATAASGAPKPQASDVGITDTQIRLGIIADVDTPVKPGLFQSAVDTMNGWAKIVNKQGGLAGRKVVIDFIDSKLNPNETRNAIIKACSQDFAIVGGEALFMNNVDDLIACKDAQGNATGLPDIPGLALDDAEKCSSVSFLTSGDSSFCATKDQNPQTRTGQAGDGIYYVKHNKDLHGVFAVPNDLKGARNSQLVDFLADVNAGMKKDGQGFYDVTAQAPQSALTPIIQVAKNNSSTFVYNGEAPGIMVLLRREAKLQGLTSVKAWACNQGCYDADFLKQGGADVEGTTSVLTIVPFYSEYKSNPALKALVAQLGGVAKLNANAVAAYVAALLFQDAVGKAVASGPLNRASLLAALRAEHAFDASGITGPIDVASHNPPACIVMAQVKNGKWVRLSPSKPGTFDCNKKNRATIKLGLS